MTPIAPHLQLTDDVDRDATPQESFVAGPAPDLFSQASRRMRRLVPYDAAGWFALDPSTLLPTNPTLIENVVPVECDRYWVREFSVEDVSLFRHLARAPRPVATLRASTSGSPFRSTRFREHMDPTGYGDELRAVFRQGEQTWGSLVLLRNHDREPFSGQDVARVTAMVSSMASSLAAVARTSARGLDAASLVGPGTALYDAAGRLTSLDRQAEQWFVELAGPDWDATDPLTGLTSALIDHARAITTGRRPGPATARLRTRSGRWLMLNASRLRSLNGRPAPFAIVIEPAASTDVMSLIVEAYSLTAREQEVTQAVARGLSNNEIAGQLFLSPHTVRDHLKAVFGKTDVSSRGELVAKLFADHYQPIHTADGAVQHTYW